MEVHLKWRDAVRGESRSKGRSQLQVLDSSSTTSLRIS